MNAADVVAELESRYPCVQGIFRHQCQTGDVYVTIGFEQPLVGEHYPPGPWGPIPGVVREGHRRRRYDHETEACEDFLRAFGLFEEEWGRRHPPEWRSKAVLYWRYDAPHIFWYAEDRALNCRLAISALPVVAIDDAAYDAARRAELEREITQGARPA